MFYDKKRLTISLIRREWKWIYHFTSSLSKREEEAEFEHMVDSLLILKLEHSVMIITEDKEDFILEFLKDCQKELKPKKFWLT